MISSLPVPAVLVFLASACLHCHAADRPPLIHWEALSNPRGIIVDEQLFRAPEIRGQAEAVEESGILRFDGGSMLLGVTDEERFRQLLQRNDEFTVELTVVPALAEQAGPARIFTYSSDHSKRNFSIGQQGDRFDLRLRTEGGSENGIIPGSSFGKIEAGETYRLIVSYRPGDLKVSVNGELLIERSDVTGGLQNWMPHQLVFGDEVNGGRAWRGEIHALALHDWAKPLRQIRADQAGGDAEASQLSQRAIAALERQVETLERRIRAGDMAGEKLEAMLAAALDGRDGAPQLEAQLQEARAIAEREHERAERISAEVLAQIEAQKAIGLELQETIAKLNRLPEPDREAQQRLLAENEELSQSLKEAWETNKLRETRQREIEAALAKQRAEAVALASEKSELEAQLVASHTARQELEKKLEDLMSEETASHEKAIAQRAGALRERILRKRLEAQLEDAAAEREADADSATREGIGAAAAAPTAEASLFDIAPIYFGKNQADSEGQERSLVAQVAEIHQRFPGARFRISGHTCTDGNADGNLALSQRRAQRIANLLQENGIPAAAIAGVIGKGQTSPIADNKTQQGREANRRVEIEVLRE